jgi:hypothetical protein
MQPNQEREKQVLAVCDEIRKFVVNSSGGFKSDAVTNQLNFFISQLRSTVGRGHAWDEIPILKGWCDKYFSDQKHSKQPGGLPQIQQEILKSLDNIKEYVMEED